MGTNSSNCEILQILSLAMSLVNSCCKILLEDTIFPCKMENEEKKRTKRLGYKFYRMDTISSEDLRPRAVFSSMFVPWSRAIATHLV